MNAMNTMNAMHQNRRIDRAIAKERQLAWACALLAATALAGCASTSSISVQSTPPGARILIDGVDAGQQTPGSVTLSTSKKRYDITIDKAGYNPVQQTVELGTDVDVIDADEAVGTICISPCCCFLPLLRLLDPVDIKTQFRPTNISVELEVAGQGVRLEVTTTPFEAYLDGKLVALLDGNYIVTSPGDHELEVRAPGRRSFVRSIHVDERAYQRLKIELEPEGQGLLVGGSPKGAKVYLDDQFQGNLGDEARRVRAEPGPHLLRVDADGHRSWQDVVQVVTDRFQELTIDLKLEGQGVIVRKPEGLSAKTPEIQVVVDGQLQASAFDQPIRMEPGEHQIEIRVTGREPRRIQLRVTKDAFIEVEPGRKADKDAARAQERLETTGLVVHAPVALGKIAVQDVQILIDGVLRSQHFDEAVECSERNGYRVTVTVKGYQPWEQVVAVTRGQLQEVYPALEPAPQKRSD